jgi:hypothetical protein
MGRGCVKVLVLIGIASMVPEGIGNTQAVPPQKTKSVGCGTVESALEKSQCILVSFSGEVSDGQDFERSFGADLLFRLTSKGKQEGWDIEVVPQRNGDAGNSEYVWVVTPPYRSGNPRYLDTSYGMSAKQAVAASPRHFNFVLNEEQFKKAVGLVDLAIMSRPSSGIRSPQEITREVQKATEALLAFSVAKGRLTIVDSKIESADEKGNPGYLKWLKFKVELRVPCDFAVSERPEVVVDKNSCSAEGSPKRE